MQKDVYALQRLSYLTDTNGFAAMNACEGFKAKEGRGRLPGNLSDKRLELCGFISPGERPAHIAGSVTHIGANAAGSPLFLVGQGFDNEWYNCKQTTEMDEQQQMQRSKDES